MRPIYTFLLALTSLLALIMGTTATAEINSGGGASVIGTRSNYSSIGGYLATQATSIGDNESRNGFIDVMIAKAGQTITFAPIDDQLTTDTVTLTATGGGSPNPVTFAVTAGPATISNGVPIQLSKQKSFLKRKLRL